MLAVLLALGILAATPSLGATPTPSPTPYKPLAIPLPGATPWGPLSLAGVTLGETGDAVRARLGEPALANDKPEISIWTYPLDNKHVALNIFLSRGRVTSLSIALTGGAKQSLFADPFGLHLGDGADTMFAVRGQPRDMIENRNIYATGPGFDWVYQFDKGIAASILVDANIALNGPLPSPVAGPPGHDGTSLERAIRFKVANQTQAKLYEAVFLARFCDGKGTWQPTAVSTLANPQTGSVIVAYSVTCSNTLRKAMFYFDRSHLPNR